MMLTPEVVELRRSLFDKKQNLDPWEMHFNVLTTAPFSIWFEHEARAGLRDYLGLERWLEVQKKEINNLYGQKALRPFTQVGTQLPRGLRIISEEDSRATLQRWSNDQVASVTIDEAIGRMVVEVYQPDRFFHDTSCRVNGYGAKTMLATIAVAEMQAAELDRDIA